VRTTADYVMGVRIAEFGGLEVGDVTFVVRLLRLGTVLVEREVTIFVEGSVGVTVVITRECSTVTCEVGSACLGGECVNARCTPETPEFCATPTCTADDDCADTISCTADFCFDGTCFRTADDTLCAAGEMCEPTLDCVTAVMDAGADAGDTGPPMDASDGGGLDADADTTVDAGPPLGEFPPGTVIAAIPSDSDDPTLTGDLTQLFFNRDGDIWLSTRASSSASRGAPAVVSELSDPTLRETDPTVSPDGLEMWLSRGPSGGDFNLYFSRRGTPTGTWSAPTIESSLSSVAGEFPTYLSADKRTLIFHSSRDRGDPRDRNDVYIATRPSAGGAWSTPMIFPSLGDLTIGERNGFLFARELRMVHTEQPLETAVQDIFERTRSSTAMPFGPAMPMSLNTSDDETDPWLSEDGRYMAYVIKIAAEFVIVETTR